MLMIHSFEGGVVKRDDWKMSQYSHGVWGRQRKFGETNEREFMGPYGVVMISYISRD